MQLPTAFPVLAGGDFLFVSCSESDCHSLEDILDTAHVTVKWVSSVMEAWASLLQRPFGVVICDTDLPDGSWQYLLTALADLSPEPNLIVSSRLADERLWAEVLNLGGYDVLLSPFEKEEVRRVSMSALSDWRRRLTASPARKAPVTVAESRPPKQKALAASSGAV